MDAEKIKDWCLGCINHQMTLKGVICSLSKAIPSFEDNCNDYKDDYESLKKSQRLVVKSNQKVNSNFYEAVVTKRKDWSKDAVTKLPKQVIIRNSKRYFYLWMFLLFIGDFLLPFYIHTPIEGIPFYNNSSFWELYALLFFSSFLLYIILFSFVLDRSSKIILNDKGIVVDSSNLFSWDKAFTYILHFYYSSNNINEQVGSLYLAVKSPFEKEKTIRIDFLEKSSDEIENLIELYKLKYFSKNIHNPN